MVVGVVILLECWETKSLTLPIGDVSARVGEGWLPKKLVRGGERGDSTLTDGVNCGEDCMTIDIGRLWPNFGGEVLLPRSSPGVCGDDALF